MRDGVDSRLDALVLHPLSGEERFHAAGPVLQYSVLDFWRWAASNLAGNNLRGHLAEFLVARDLGVSAGVRVEWDECDLLTPSGLRVEVKSAAYLQSWKQARPSRISFSIRPSRSWSEGGGWSDTPVRCADAYVFCVLNHQDKNTLDPLNVRQWEFYVVATQTLTLACGGQKQISLKSLLRIPPVRCAYGEIGQAIESVCRPRTSAESIACD